MQIPPTKAGKLCRFRELIVRGIILPFFRHFIISNPFLFLPSSSIFSFLAIVSKKDFSMFLNNIQRIHRN